MNQGERGPGRDIIRIMDGRLCCLLTSMGPRPVRLTALCLMWAALWGVPQPAAAAQRVDSWLDVVRQTPYWASQGVAENLSTIRRWVLLGKGYCNDTERQILFDRRGRFLGYIENAATVTATTRRLNQARERLADQHRVDYWSPGSDTGQGYPFALSCDQPHVDMDDAIARMVGADKKYRLWGTWDGMRIGSPDRQVSLVKMIRDVYEHLKTEGRIAVPQKYMPDFIGKTIIESGAKKHALSTESARGIMQLQPGVLDDCEIPKDFRLHRMAQVECALRLVDQNDRNLAPPFEKVFGKLPEEKRKRLYRLLLIQAYQIGVGRMIELLQDKELGKPAHYFAGHAARFSAEDIQLGMIYHNLGRKDIGMMSLYYVTDVRIATRALCDSPAMRDDTWCVQTDQ